jgi:hypothetical protein
MSPFITVLPSGLIESVLISDDPSVNVFNTFPVALLYTVKVLLPERVISKELSLLKIIF